jgi:hypothetical protein
MATMSRTLRARVVATASLGSTRRSADVTIVASSPSKRQTGRAVLHLLEISSRARIKYDVDETFAIAPREKSTRTKTRARGAVADRVKIS